MMKRVDIRAILRAPILRAEVKARCWGDRVGELSLVPLGEERPRPHRSRRMAPSLSDTSLILHPLGFMQWVNLPIPG